MNSESIRISHPDLIKIREVKSSGTCDLKEGKLLRYFETKSSPGISVLILEFEDISNLNQIRLHSNSQEIAFFRIRSDSIFLWMESFGNRSCKRPDLNI